MKMRFFLGSSSEQLPIAEALERNLCDAGFEPTLWPREAHRASEYNLEALLREASTSDFAAFVFAPDDRVVIRGEAFAVVRDNIPFELGLFIGVLGRSRCFVVQPAEQAMRLPPDLDGLTTLKYDSRRSDGNLRRALGPVTTSIADLVRKEAVAAASGFTPNDLKLLQSCKDPSMPSNQHAKAFGSMPSAWDDKLCMRFLRLQDFGLLKPIGPTEVQLTRKGELLAKATRVEQR